MCPVLWLRKPGLAATSAGPRLAIQVTLSSLHQRTWKALGSHGRCLSAAGLALWAGGRLNLALQCRPEDPSLASRLRSVRWLNGHQPRSCPSQAALTAPEISLLATLLHRHPLGDSIVGWGPPEGDPETKHREQVVCGRQRRQLRGEGPERDAAAHSPPP